MDRYASHLPLLKKVFELKTINKVLEFGCGEYSTGFFINNSKEVIFIEMQSEEWFNKISDQYKEYSNVKGILSLGAHSFKNLNIFTKIDLCFVDGHGDSRPDCINFIQPYTDIIMAHDTETYSYGWNRISFFKKMYSFQYKNMEPFTTIWSSDAEFIETLKKSL